MKRFSAGYVFIPQARRDDYNAACESLGFGSNFFSAPIQRGGSPNVTHYAACASLTDTQWESLAEIVHGTANAITRVKGRPTRDGFKAAGPK